jgi:hypothetical protein
MMEKDRLNQISGAIADAAVKVRRLRDGIKRMVNEL